MSTLANWINPYYLRPSTISDIKETIAAKPLVKYTVLDNFFIEEKLEEWIKYHLTLEFSENYDKYTGNGQMLPYDSAVNFAQKGAGFASELFFDDEWLAYLSDLCGLAPSKRTEVKQRYHSADADGFWVHTDAVQRNIAAIGYFNKGWKASDGGLLQLWMVDDVQSPSALHVESPTGKMGFLSTHKRLKTMSPGGGFPDNQSHDLVLIDQIVPLYNRLFLANLIAAPSYHSVSPSNGRIRLGFVQWILQQ
jgi:hypothetical protein